MGKTKRQGLKVTIGQLRRIANELEENLKRTFIQANCEYPTFAGEHQVLSQINIINEEGTSDGWEIEELDSSKK